MVKIESMENGKQPAHPVQINNDVDVHNYGLTKREYFAGQALIGLSMGRITAELKQGECCDVAEMAILIADELLKQLNDEQ